MVCRAGYRAQLVAQCAGDADRNAPAGAIRQGGVELKAGKFKPEHLGQLGFYLTAVDRQVKALQDNPTIGLLLCKSKNEVVAEYALGDKSQPMGIAEYKLAQSLPAELQTSLPSIEQIERELAKDD